uniref:Uncharacterized protein n=1 Tax=viral metagenome TaxID=1070528 RepID=A0A6M3JAJ3_9ZZZZ
MESKLLNYVCTKCGVSLRRQILFALMIDCGAKTSDPSECPQGGDHDFQPPPKKKE